VSIIWFLFDKEQEEITSFFSSLPAILLAGDFGPSSLPMI
jgi:hypothetical protein